jgi:hypothetical protein
MSKINYFVYILIISSTKSFSKSYLQFYINLFAISFLGCFFGDVFFGSFLC